jgi:leader peptidase (prepilin peptidase)/N-methyltransferase
MEWWMFLPVVMWCICIFVLGLVVGSFLNVLIARLPYEKSIVWPSSRCFACYRPIRLFDNLPIIGYLRLRGRCRHCGAAFSSRYLWVEVGTGVAFLALFAAEVLLNANGIAVNNVNFFAANLAIPPGRFLAHFAYHAVLVSCLIAAAVIDAQHRVIPPLIPYFGVTVGIVGGALMPWPWPNPAAAGIIIVPGLAPNAPWVLPEFWGLVPAGVQPWPFWGPTFAFAPPGSWQLGLLTSVIGALAGSLAVRAIKWLFETGFGREALGLGDADLLMMAGAFLGWQIAVFALFVGALAAIVLKILSMVLLPSRSTAEAPADAPRQGDSRELPFGPGLALGIVITWFAWPWLGPRVQFAFFDHVATGLAVAIMGVGLLAAGLLLRRPAEAPTGAEART